MSNRARATSCASARGGCSTVDAMLRELSWCAEGATMNLFVAGHANRQTVIDNGRQIGKIGQWLNVVSVNVSAFFAAFLTRVIVPNVNRTPPLFEIALQCSTSGLRRQSTFPYGRCFARSPLDNAFLRTEFCSCVYRVKVLSASCARFDVWLSAFSPARLRAISSCLCPVRLYLEIFTAHLALCCAAILALFGGVNLCAFRRACWLFPTKWMKFFAANPALSRVVSALSHNTIIAHHALYVNYVAVALQRWADHTGKTPVLLDSQNS